MCILIVGCVQGENEQAGPSVHTVSLEWHRAPLEQDNGWANWFLVAGAGVDHDG